MGETNSTQLSKLSVWSQDNSYIVQPLSPSNHSPCSTSLNVEPSVQSFFLGSPQWQYHPHPLLSSYWISSSFSRLQEAHIQLLVYGTREKRRSLLRLGTLPLGASEVLLLSGLSPVSSSSTFGDIQAIQELLMCLSQYSHYSVNEYKHIASGPEQWFLHQSTWVGSYAKPHAD